MVIGLRFIIEIVTCEAPGLGCMVGGQVRGVIENKHREVFPSNFLEQLLRMAQGQKSCSEKRLKRSDLHSRSFFSMTPLPGFSSVW